MATTAKSIKVLGTRKSHPPAPGPNTSKVIVILEELAIPYHIHSFSFADVKKKPFIDINPNGRAPAIQDPNTDITLWETGAITQYLIEQYDTKKKLTYTDLIRRSHLNQYLMYQVSGQVPYFGQLGWFSVFHYENLPSAIERYQNETRRILSVLEGLLEGKDWLVGDKITFADLAFLPYNDRVWFLGVPAEERWNGFPNVKGWHERMTPRKSWVKCMGIRERLPKDVGNKKEYEEQIKKSDASAATQE
ncbi:glutathione S-transferase [Setomelanomma holmii]|uniref:glutathione transferase n=1 Tax=Setomelanomma holmii TaxID=210430 RepID=A0A9P4LF27_9PLEO|nr:glutathione S-transferase [Setomelanomma holmii]